MKIHVEKADGTTFDLTFVDGAVTRNEDKKDRAVLVTTTSDATSQTLDEEQDEVYLQTDGGVNEFGGLLDRVEQRGTETNLKVNGFEQYAIDAARTSENGSDASSTGVSGATVVKEAIGDVPQLSEGTVDTIKTGLSFVTSRISQSRKIRTVAGATGAYVRYNADKTVDYLSSAGTDWNIEVTRDKAQGGATAIESFDVKRVGGDDYATHLKVYGAGGGASSQLVVTVVPSADGGTYENKATYTSTWSSGDRKIWADVAVKNVLDTTTLQETGKEIVQERNIDHIEVSTELDVDTPVQLGDTFPVSDSLYGIDQRLQVVKLTRQVDSDGSDTHEVTLSSRRLQREREQERTVSDMEKWRKDFQGDVVRISETKDRAVDSSHDLLLRVKYPSDVIKEKNAELYLAGDNYRTYLNGSIVPNYFASDPSPASDSGTSVSLTADTWTDLQTVTPNDTTSEWFGWIEVKNESGSGKTISVRFQPEPDYQETWFDFADQEKRSYTAQHWGDANTLKWQVESVGSSATIDYESYISAEGEPSINIDPGIQDWDGTENSPAHYPENISVTVNGNAVSGSITFDSGTEDGTQAFEATLPMGGELSAGWNTIAVSSGGLGWLDATFVADLFRRSI